MGCLAIWSGIHRIPDRDPAPPACVDHVATLWVGTEHGGAPLFQAATANLNPWTEVKVDTESSERGPSSSSPARRITSCRGRSRTHRSSIRTRTPASPRSSRCPTGGMRSRSTTAGGRSRARRSCSLAGLCRSRSYECRLGFHALWTSSRWLPSKSATLAA